MIEVTLPVWVGLLTGSPGHVAGIVAAEILPSLVAGPLAGALADRLDARRVMMACDLLRAILVLSLLLAPAPLLVPCIYAVGFLLALVGLLFNPAKNIAVRSVVETEGVPRALALSRTTESAALILGPAVGSGLLLSFGPSVGLVFDALTFFIGAGAVASARVPLRVISSSAASASAGWLRRLLGEIGEGVEIVARDADLLAVFAVGAVVQLVGYVWFSVDVFFVEISLGAPKESVGALWAAAGAGGLLGGLAAVAGERWLPRKRMLLLGLAIKGVALVWYAFSTDYVPAMVAALVSGFGGSLVSVAAGAFVMNRASPATLGRVTALFEFIGQLTTLLALLALGLVHNLLAPSQILLLCAVLVCASFVGAALRFALGREP